MDMVSQHDADRGMDERRREGWEEGARVGWVWGGSGRGRLTGLVLGFP